MSSTTTITPPPHINGPELILTGILGAYLLFLATAQTHLARPTPPQKQIVDAPHIEIELGPAGVPPAGENAIVPAGQPRCRGPRCPRIRPQILIVPDAGVEIEIGRGGRVQTRPTV